MSTQNVALGAHYLHVATAIFQSQKALAEKAMAQVGAEELHWHPDPESNSIAILIKHLAGNMLSRWSDFLTTDGEKPGRNRDGEFIDEGASHEALMALWENGWNRLFVALGSLSEEDLQKTVTIRGRPLTVLEAINRQISHYGYHVGQIVYIARHLAAQRPGGDAWQSLSRPKKR